MEQFATFLMFEGQAEAAMNFYLSLFTDTAVLHIDRYGPNEAGAEGSIRHAAFRLNNHQMMCIDSPSPHEFTFTPSISLYVTCKNEAEIDRLFTALSHEGQIFMPLGPYPFSPKFGWCADRFGVSWQLTLNPS